MIQEFFPVLDAVPMGDLWVLLIWGLLVAFVWMFILWLWNFKLRQPALRHFGWGMTLAILGLFDAFKADGYGPRRFLLGAMVFVWGALLALRVWAEEISDVEPSEEPEGIKALLGYFGRAFAAVLLSVPIALLVLDPLQEITAYEWIGIAFWCVAIVGQRINPSHRSLFDWLVWVAYFLAALSTPYGPWTLVCPLVMMAVLKPFNRPEEA